MADIEIDQKGNINSEPFPGLRLIWINSGRLPDADFTAMTSTQRPPIRHCPVCGIAMQAKKSREDLPHFDTFNCLSCQTSIVETQTQPPATRSR
jgi:hypothetical protein